MNQTRDGTAALDHSREIDRLAGIVQWGPLAAGLVSPMTVVAPLILGKRLPQVPFTVNQQVVKALAPQCADKPFGVGVRPGRSRRRLDDLYATAGEDLVKRP
jgi:hypothetical protein